MATFYFNGAVNGEWTELGNWWTDDTFTTQATSLPTSADDVIASASIGSNSGSAPTVVNFTLNDPFGNYYSLGIPITVTGNATFNGNTYTYGIVTGDATFNDSSYNADTVTGSATFNEYSYNVGTVTGDATFNDSSGNYSTVTGDGTFNGNAVNAVGSVVSGNAVFNDNSYSESYVVGNVTFNDTSTNFTGGYVGGNATFNDTSSNIQAGTVLGDAAFNDSSFNNEGVVNGNSTITGKPLRIAAPIPIISFSFSRAQLGVNGSSILGVI